MKFFFQVIYLKKNKRKPENLHFHRVVVIFVVTLVLQSETIDVICDFGYPYEWENIGNVYTCTVQNLTVTIANENVTNIVGTHEKGKTHLDVFKLNIPKPNKVSFIPKGFEKFFPNLTGLRVAQTGLVSLTHGDLKSFPKLRNCDMFNNMLRTLSSNLFQSTPDVDYLYFGDNRLGEIGYDIFKTIPKLKKAVFQGNNCIRSNANIKTEVPTLQEEMNKKCATATYLEIQRLLKLEQEEEEKIHRYEQQLQEEEEEIHRLQEHTDKQNKDSSSTFTLWFLSILIVCGAVSIGYYFLKYKRGSLSDSDSSLKFCNNTNESSTPYENLSTPHSILVS